MVTMGTWCVKQVPEAESLERVFMRMTGSGIAAILFFRETGSRIAAILVSSHACHHLGYA